MAPRIAFMGAGAIGSYLGGYMSREGYAPVLIDPWPEHVNKMKQDGLRVSGSEGDFTVPVRALHLTEVQNVAEPFDIIFIAVKSYDTEWATMFAKRYLAPGGFMVGAQNGMNDETIARIVGYERTVPLVMSTISVGLLEPAHVSRGSASGRDRGYVVFRAGELNGMVTPRVHQLVEMLECVDASKATSNIWGERWSKLASNSMGNTMAAMAGVPTGDLPQAAPRFPALRDQVVRELVQVGLTLGVSIEPIGSKPAAEWLELPQQPEDAGPSDASRTGSGESRGTAWATSTLQDVLKGRKTEVDYLNGYVSERGRELGIATPVNDAIVRVLREVDAGVRPVSPANVDAVWESAYGTKVAAVTG